MIKTLFALPLLFVSFLASACFSFETSCVYKEIMKDFNYQFTCVPFDDDCTDLKNQANTMKKLFQWSHKNKHLLQKGDNGNTLQLSKTKSGYSSDSTDRELNLNFVNKSSEIIKSIIVKINLYNKENIIVESVTKHIKNVNIYSNATQDISTIIKTSIAKMDYIEAWNFEIVGVIADIDTKTTLSDGGLYSENEYMATFLNNKP
jgi:hypothetical protein